MKLIDILVRELPRRGGWPDGYDVVSTNGYGAVWAYKTIGCIIGRELYFHSTTEGYVTRAQYEAARANDDRLEQGLHPAWNGEGLPPVGTICQMRDDNNNWVDIEIIANHKGFAHGWQDSTEYTYYSNKPSEFRPLRTERDKAIEQIRKVGSSLPASVPFAIEEAAAIYDAIVAGKIDGLGKVG